MALLKDEFKLYLWRNSTLRDVVRLVHASAHLSQHAISRDQAACSPFALHGLRLVYFDSKRDSFIAREMARDVARVSAMEYTAALLGAVAPSAAQNGTGTATASNGAGPSEEGSAEDLLLDEEKAVLQRLRTIDRPGDAARTLRKCQLRDGDMLECVILPDRGPGAAAGSSAPPRAGLGVAGPSRPSRGGGGGGLRIFESAGRRPLHR